MVKSRDNHAKLGRAKIWIEIRDPRRIDLRKVVPVTKHPRRRVIPDPKLKKLSTFNVFKGTTQNLTPFDMQKKVSWKKQRWYMKKQPDKQVNKINPKFGVTNFKIKFLEFESEEKDT